MSEARLDAVSEFDGAASLLRARLGVTAIFFANGLGIGAWAVAIPQVKALFSLSDVGLSLILLAAGLGAIAAMPAAGLLPPRMGGTGRTLRISAPIWSDVLASMPAMSALPAASMALAGCAFLFGFSNILVDVPMNAHASVIERAWGRAIMSSFHAAWSAGGLIGSAIGGFLISAGASPVIQLGVEAALCFLLAAIGSLSIGVGDRHAHGTAFALPHGRLIALATIALLAVFVEMSVTDWSALSEERAQREPGRILLRLRRLRPHDVSGPGARRLVRASSWRRGCHRLWRIDDSRRRGVCCRHRDAGRRDFWLLLDWPRSREHGARSVQRQRPRRSHGLRRGLDRTSAFRRGGVHIEPARGICDGDRGCAGDRSSGHAED